MFEYTGADFCAFATAIPRFLQGVPVRLRTIGTSSGEAITLTGLEYTFGKFAAVTIDFDKSEPTVEIFGPSQGSRRLMVAPYDGVESQVCEEWNTDITLCGTLRAACDLTKLATTSPIDGFCLTSTTFGDTAKDIACDGPTGAAQDPACYAVTSVKQACSAVDEAVSKACGVANSVFGCAIPTSPDVLAAYLL